MKLKSWLVPRPQQVSLGSPNTHRGSPVHLQIAYDRCKAKPPRPRQMRQEGSPVPFLEDMASEKTDFVMKIDGFSSEGIFKSGNPVGNESIFKYGNPVLSPLTNTGSHFYTDTSHSLWCAISSMSLTILMPSQLHQRRLSINIFYHIVTFFSMMLMTVISMVLKYSRKQ